MSEKFLRRHHEDNLRKEYRAAPGVTEKKKNDLLKLCAAHVIPSLHYDYFNSLAINSDAAPDTVEDDRYWYELFVNHD